MTRIRALGTALPTHSLPTDQCVEHAKQFNCSNRKQERILEEVYRRAAILRRRSVLTGCGYGDKAERVFAAPLDVEDSGPSTGHRMQYYASHIGSLAKRASEAAFADSSISKQEITHLVTVSCTGFYAPGFDIELIHNLPLSRSTARTHVGFMGCHGGMNGLRVAKAYADSDPKAKVLLCMAEACTLHFQYGWSTNKIVANALFSDGAAAVVVAGDGDDGWELISSASFVIPDSTDAMLWRIGDNGFEMHLSVQVPSLIEEWLPTWLAEWLAAYGYTKNDISGWAIHPGGPKILDAVQSCLNLDDAALAASREILAECGNMSSPTVFFILEMLRARSFKGPIVVLGFGPGLTVEAALLRA